MYYDHEVSIRFMARLNKIEIIHCNKSCSYVSNIYGAIREPQNFFGEFQISSGAIKISMGITTIKPLGIPMKNHAIVTKTPLNIKPLSKGGFLIQNMKDG